MRGCVFAFGELKYALAYLKCGAQCGKPCIALSAHRAGGDQGTRVIRLALPPAAAVLTLSERSTTSRCSG